MSASNALQLIAVLNDLASLLVNGSQAVATVTTTLRRAQEEGRDVSAEELDVARSARKVVISDLQTEIERRQSQG